VDDTHACRWVTLEIVASDARRILPTLASNRTRKRAIRGGQYAPVVEDVSRPGFWKMSGGTTPRIFRRAMLLLDRARAIQVDRRRLILAIRAWHQRRACRALTTSGARLRRAEPTPLPCAPMTVSKNVAAQKQFHRSDAKLSRTDRLRSNHPYMVLTCYENEGENSVKNSPAVLLQKWLEFFDFQPETRAAVSIRMVAPHARRARCSDYGPNSGNFRGHAQGRLIGMPTCKEARRRKKSPHAKRQSFRKMFCLIRGYAQRPK